MGSWYFDGIDDRLELADSVALRSLSTTYTIWGWAKPLPGGQTYGGLVAKTYSSTNPAYSSWCVQQAGTAAGQLRNHGVVEGTNWGMDNTMTFTDQWIFFAASRNGTASRFRIWDDTGNLVEDVTDTVVPLGTVTYSALPLYLGASHGLSHWRGHLAYVGAHNIIVTNDDLAIIRTTGDPPFIPSAFYTPLDGNTATDTAQNGAVTVFGAVASADSPPLSTQNIIPDFYFYRDGVLTGSTIHRYIPDATPTEPVTQWNTIFFDDTMLNTYKDRAVNGPYKSTGDAGTNSPGDWDLVVNEKNQFIADPWSHRWGGPKYFVGCSTSGALTFDNSTTDTQSMMRLPTKMNSAAFIAWVNQDLSLAELTRDVLIGHIDYDDLKFNDRTRYSLTTGLSRADNHFTLAFGDWFAAIVVTYDILRAYEQAYGASLFTATQITDFENWCNGIAVWGDHWQHQDLNQLFVNRLADDYTLTPAGTDNVGAQILYDGQLAPLKASVKYNNRQMRFARLIGLGAIVGNNQTIIDRNKRTWREMLMFGYFPFGAVSDFERWETGSNSNFTKGWKYGAEYCSTMVTIAVALQNVYNDTDLLTYSTTDGSAQSSGTHWSGGGKTLEKLCVDILRYVGQDWSPIRTVSGTAIHPATEWIHELGFSHILLLFPNNTYIRNTLKRINAPGWPASPREGNFEPQRADNGSFPGGAILFFDLNI